jgi:flagellar basal-body rod protein FlgC
MGIFASMKISASALRAERARMDVITENIANVETTRTPEGGPYRRQQVVLSTWRRLGAPERMHGGRPAGAGWAGVRVAAIEPAAGELPRVYNPSHPDADEEGYVQMPNVDLPTEMADMIVAARAYEANAAAFRAGRDMVRSSLSILA